MPLRFDKIFLYNTESCSNNYTQLDSANLCQWRPISAHSSSILFHHDLTTLTFDFLETVSPVAITILKIVHRTE